MNINELAKEIHENAKKHGFYDKPESEYPELKNTLRHTWKYLTEYANGKEIVDIAAKRAADVIDALEAKLAERTFGDIVALCHSELSEALEEYRDGKPNIYESCALSPEYCTYYDVCDDHKSEECKPQGIAVELADTIIRILDFTASKGIDIEAVIMAKHKYNTGRDYRHGGKVI